MPHNSSGLGRRVSVWLACAALVLPVPAGEARPREAEPPDARRETGPLSPEDAQRRFRLDEGLRIGLVAAEPLVRSPVAIAFDEGGRLWVAEMPDYPIGPPGAEPPQGRIVVLEDRDADGRYERSTEFMKSVLFATGVLPWRGGAFVTGQFGIHYMKDTDGDGEADLRDPLYEGSYTEVSQHFLNSPTLGFDGWVYVANGLRTETIVKAGGESAPVDVRGLDFRFDPLGNRHQAAAGMGQFGMSLDRWGRRFTVTNRNHVIHVVAPHHYLERNPHVTLPRQRDDQGPGGAARIYPLSPNWTTSIRHAGTFTAACGITVYEGNLLGPPWRGSAFTAEPTGNLVHQSILAPRGATFTAERAREGVEFLASPDPWFRPVNMSTGPDSALYVVDMYMAEIEHPVYVPEDRRGRMDIRGGSGLGRIWRIVPEGHRRTPRRPDHLGGAALEDLVSAHRAAVDPRASGPGRGARAPTLGPHLGGAPRAGARGVARPGIRRPRSRTRPPPARRRSSPRPGERRPPRGAVDRRG
jgi:putative membrane-bound dehydrogenase-like protein